MVSLEALEGKTHLEDYYYYYYFHLIPLFSMINISRKSLRLSIFEMKLQQSHDLKLERQY